jgi:hypothetical protein
MWILLIVVILGIAYYIGGIYGSPPATGDDKKKKDKESFADSESESDDEEEKPKPKKKVKETFSQSEEEEEDKKKKKKKVKVKDICFGDFCLPKDKIQEEIEDMDDDTKEELIKMLKKS